jgi:hypothetical protein
MNSSLLFLLLIVVLAVISIILVFSNPKNATNYFKTSPGKKVLKGILAFSGVALVSVRLWLP